MLALAGGVLAACGSPAAATPTPPPAQPTPLLNPFPNADVPVSGASADLQRVWRPYDVTVVPARHVPDSAPPAPNVVNATAGLVRDADAQHWATAFYRTQGWLKWAASKGQGAFIKHIDKSLPTYQFDTGATETLPDCELYPTSMALVVDAGTGDHSDRSQFAFVTTYTGPCTAVFNEPDGTQQKASSITGTLTMEHLGWMRADPLLGDVWVDTQSWRCDYTPCVPVPNPPPAESAVPDLPDVVTPVAAAAPALRAAWAPYELTVIPAKTVTTDIPALPPLTNNTGGVVDQQTAELWERGVMRESAWVNFSWGNLQLDFQRHLSGGQSFAIDQKLLADANNGGKPTMLPCAVFPTSLTLQPVSAKEQTNVTFADRLQWEFVATYQRPCTLQVGYANGTSGTVDLPGTLVLYGSFREDPMLGDIWFSDTVAEPLS